MGAQERHGKWAVEKGGRSHRAHRRGWILPQIVLEGPPTLLGSKEQSELGGRKLPSPPRDAR